MIAIIVLTMTALGMFVVGVMIGRASSRDLVRGYEQHLTEIGKFARQQSAVGDPTGTVVSDMVEKAWEGN